MHDIIDPKEVKRAVENADMSVVDFISNADEDNALEHSLKSFNISAEDAKIIHQELVYVAIGLSRADELIENVLVNTEGDEERISFAVDFIEKNVLPLIGGILKAYPINQGPSSHINNLPPGTKRSTVDILMAEIGHGAENTHGVQAPGAYMPSKTDLLSEIESPTLNPTPQFFSQPQAKPSTADILGGLADAKYTVADTAKVTQNNQEVTIIDPFRKHVADEKSQREAEILKTSVANATNASNTNISAVISPAMPKIESSVVFSNSPTVAPSTQTQTQAPEGSKFNKISTAPVNASFTSAPSHDPYREHPAA